MISSGLENQDWGHDLRGHFLTIRGRFWMILGVIFNDFGGHLLMILGYFLTILGLLFDDFEGHF